MSLRVGERERSGPGWRVMGHYLLRRLLIAIPSLLGISVVLFTVLALAPGDPFEELATNPAVPPEVRAALRAKFGLDDPVAGALRALARRHAAGRLGLLVRQPHRRRHADPAAPADDAVRHRLVADPGLLVALPVGIFAATRPYSLFDQIASTLAFIGFSLPTFFTGLLLHPGVQHLARLAALRLPRRHRRHRLALVLGALQAGDHAGRRARPVPGRLA